MSHAGLILGLPELEVERVDRNDAIAVYAKPRKRPCCLHCQHPNVRIKATYQRTLKHTRQGNQLITLYLRTPKYHCPRCGRYFRHRFKGVRPRYRASEAFRLEVFEAHDGGVTQAKLKRTHQTAPATTERWYRGLLSLMRRHAWRLKPEQRENLQRYLSNYPGLAALYDAKQLLNELLLLKNLRKKTAQKMLPKLLKLIEQLRHSPLRRLAKTLTSWLEPIVMMWRFSKSNGPTEGFHTKMEMMTRRAYGFRNFENYRLRVLTHCGWDGIINRV